MCAVDDVLVQMVMIVRKAGTDKDSNVADFDGDEGEDGVHNKVAGDTLITCPKGHFWQYFFDGDNDKGGSDRE